MSAADDLHRRLLHRREATADAAIAEAVALGQPGDTILASAMDDATGFRRVELAAAAGDLRAGGPADDALRRALRSTGPGTRDLRCAALVALAKRLGGAATPEFIEAFGQPDGVVKDYAVLCLATFGEDGAWQQVLTWLSKRKARQEDEFSFVEPAGSHSALSYLLRQLPEQDGDAYLDLARVLRQRWAHLTEADRQRLSERIWPEVAPGGPEDPGRPRFADLDLGGPTIPILFAASVL